MKTIARKKTSNKEEKRVSIDHAYTVVLRPEPEGGFTVRVPSFPEIVTYGSDEQEALAMAQDAIGLVLEDYADIPASDPPRYYQVTIPA